jgi:N-acetylglucosaminyl-diphospho-decaprenol L-rhamnosyltransferase
MTTSIAKPDVSAIVISLNSRKLLQDCLQSLCNAEWRNVSHEILVVDNGSTDGTQAMIRKDFPEVKLIANKRNVGYCPAGNQGAQVAQGRYLLFLNDDILILADALPRLVEFMDTHSRVGMIGSRLLNIDGTDQFSSGRTFPTLMNALFGRKSLLTRLFPNAPWARGYLLSHLVDSAEPYQVDWVSAAAMMVRSELFHALGGLAEDFYYFHEMVFCKRLQDAGFQVYLDPQSKILHYEGAGSGVRTRRVRRKHIVGFHVAAIRWFCLHHHIGAHNPVRWLVAAILWCRAALLVVLDVLKPSGRQQTQEVQAGRPEGGIAL